MAKAVFRPTELVVVPEKIMLNTPVIETTTAVVSSEEEEDEAEPEEEAYTGPTAEDLRREAEAFTEKWNIEKEEMIQAAKDEAESIVQTAQQAAEEEKQRSADEAAAAKTAAQEEAETILADARQKAEEHETQVRSTLDDEKKEALEQGREAGRLEGYEDGKVEVQRLIERTQTVLERAQDKRGDILAETGQEVINLVLLMTRKVVKVIADNQREVIISNVEQALKKVRDRGNILIHVNLADLKLTTEHTKEFIQMMEGVKSIQVVEDTSVDAGGCIIETDFGEIDARIASQLAELEAKILEVSPIKTRPKSPAVARPK
jgi:flagellar assembly protein FliH